MSDILDKIVAVKREEIAAAQQPQAARGRALRRREPRAHARLRRRPAREDRRRPGRGDRRDQEGQPEQGRAARGLHPADIAQSYAEGDGKVSAACLSVLTDQQFFQGSVDYLKQARASCDLPVLRKDFIVDAYQVYESRAMGADAILLIAACLDDAQMRDFEAIALRPGHGGAGGGARRRRTGARAEAQDAADRHQQPQPAHLRGVAGDHARPAARACPPTACWSPNRASRRREDVARLRAAGVHAFLVGEAFMRADEPGDALAAAVRMSVMRRPRRSHCGAQRAVPDERARPTREQRSGRLAGRRRAGSRWSTLSSPAPTGRQAARLSCASGWTPAPSIFPPQPLRALELTPPEAGARRHPRAGPLPRPRPGRRAGLLGGARRAAAAVAAQHLQGAASATSARRRRSSRIPAAAWSSGRRTACCCSTPA